MSGKTILFWSGGKDSALALAEMQKKQQPVDLLLVTLDRDQLTTMHGVPPKFMEQQAGQLNLPMVFVEEGENYRKTLLNNLQGFKHQGFKEIVFGDLHLQDIREFREKLARDALYNVSFPVWEKPYSYLQELYSEFEIEAQLIVANCKYFSEGEMNRSLDFREIRLKPVDLFGENGEFHTFVTHFKGFQKAIWLPAASLTSDTFSYNTLQGKKITNCFWRTVFQ